MCTHHVRGGTPNAPWRRDGLWDRYPLERDCALQIQRDASPAGARRRAHGVGGFYTGRVALLKRVPRRVIAPALAIENACHTAWAVLVRRADVTLARSLIQIVPHSAWRRVVRCSHLVALQTDGVLSRRLRRPLATSVYHERALVDQRGHGSTGRRARDCPAC